MKLIIQIPCLNEEEALSSALADLPRQVPGFDVVEWLIIDDGCTDKTVEVARHHGVDHIVRHSSNLGLARAFMSGIEACLKLGADVIVNTDADNQYKAEDLPALVAPILAGEAQIVIGARPIATIASFSPLKKLLQRAGSLAVRAASGTRIPDAPSGFRAYHWTAAVQLYVLNSYTYTIETIIQAGRKGIPMVSVPVGVNEVTRPSRLVKSIAGYVYRSFVTIIRIFVIYKPLRFFTIVSSLVALPAIVGILRFLAYYAAGDGGGHLQSLVLSGSLLAVASIVFMVGLIAETTAANRALLEDIRARQLRSLIGRESHGAPSNT